MRLLLLTLLACLALAACREPDGAGVDPAHFVAAEERCLRDGGRWQARNSGGMICVRTPPDAGQACTSSRDCAGLCLARSRTCAPVVPLFGCNEALDANGRAGTVCLQ